MEKNLVLVGLFKDYAPQIIDNHLVLFGIEPGVTGELEPIGYKQHADTVRTIVLPKGGDRE